MRSELNTRSGTWSWLISAAAMWSLACGETGTARVGTWIAQSDTLGDTIVVRTISGSVWRSPLTLVEELVIGTLEGEDELMFGQILEMAVDANGGIFVFDGQVPALRYYDSSGSYVRTLGREGSGPGEYRDQCLGLAVRTDGRLVMRDPRNGRLNVYDADGAPSAHWPVASGLFTSRAMTLDTADHMYLKILMSRPERNKPWKIGLLHLDADGQIVDTIADPPIAGQPTSSGGVFLPSKVWAWSPLRYMVVGINRDYRFELRKPEHVLRIERVVRQVPVLPEEQASWEARNDWRRENQGQFMTSELPPVPNTKPPYRTLSIGEGGRVWVQRHVTAERADVVSESRPDRPPPLEWREPSVFDVFEPDGTYLGEVHVPPRTSVHVSRGDQLWGVRRGELDEQYIVRLRIER